MNYYSQKILLAKVDREDKILGKVERWEAHEKGILHRGFTVILFYGENIILQCRKHPAFDKAWDLAFSSHQTYKENKLQRDEEAIYETLEREWNTEKNGLEYAPKYLAKIYYKAKDPKSIYTEHEVDYIFSAKLKNKPSPNLDYAYGIKLIQKSQFSVLPSQFYLAPWVEKILAEKII